jgi:hypothetical protein
LPFPARESWQVNLPSDFKLAHLLLPTSALSIIFSFGSRSRPLDTPVITGPVVSPTCSIFIYQLFLFFLFAHSSLLMLQPLLQSGLPNLLGKAGMPGILGLNQER